MRVPLSWLRDFAPFAAAPEELAEHLDELGLVVEEMKKVGEGLADVVVARVLEMASIPGADKIRRVVVDAGGEAVEVVCGAWNFSEGALVPLARVGAVLPGVGEITRRKMKGVTSNGMLCSGRELELSEDHEGILVLGGAGSEAGPDEAAVRAGGAFAATPEDIEPGTPLAEALGIEPDVVFDLAVDANRPDAACVAGVARDLAARLHLPFAIPDPPSPRAHGAPPVNELVSLEVVDRDLCPRFTMRVLTGLRVGPSPREVARRLVLAGMRPINNVVDASNYVMLELGQPTHPYDLDLVGGGGLRVRASRQGETVITLDGIERRLGGRRVSREDDMRDCLICDAGDSPIGIGGVMGGATSEIGPQTARVLLEAAYFTPMAIARTSKRLGLRTEASSRFERGVDPEGIDRAARRLCELLGASAGGAMSSAEGVLDVRGEVPGPRPVRVRTDRVCSILGADLTDEDIARRLEPIGFISDIEAPGVLAVTVPTFRPDTEREIDVIEEVARHYGYARIPRRRVFPPQVGRLDRYQRERRLVREALAGCGAEEVWTPSLLGPTDHEQAGLSGGSGAALQLANPLSPEESVLRRSLLPGMLKALAYNSARRQAEVRFFEIGHVFPPAEDRRVATALCHEDPAISVLDEREMLGVLLAVEGDDARSAVRVWHTLADALRVFGVEIVARDQVQAATDGLHPTRTADLVAVVGGAARAVGSDAAEKAEGGMLVGVVGEVDPVVLERFGVTGRRAGWLEVDLRHLLDAAPRRAQVAAPLSRFPSNDIDLAFVVEDAVPAAAVASTLKAAAGELLEATELFDVYRGPGVPSGSRSLTWRLRFCALDHTITDEEVGRLRSACIDAVGRAHGAKLRG